VAPGNEKLAEVLLYGLKQAAADGKLDQLFAKYYADVLQRLQLQQRRVLTLENPLLPAGLMLHPPASKPWQLP
jgi:hypothetical protein